MSLNRIIIHQVAKESQSNEIILQKSDELTVLDSNARILVSRLRNIYKKDNILYSVFDYGDGDRMFPNKFREYMSSEKEDENFLDMTHILTDKLVEILQVKTMAKGGYLIFAEYEDKTIDFTTIFLVRDTEGVIFKQGESGGFSINNIKYINTEKLAMACRINHGYYLDEGGSYLSLTRRSQQREISDYFTEWISTANSESSKEYTDSLYQILNKIPPPQNEETKEEYTIDEFRKAVFDYIKNRPSKITNLKDMSMHFYRDRDVITDFAEENEIKIDTEFKAHTRSLNKFVSVRINRDGVELKFSRGDFGVGKKVWISQGDPNVIMVESKKFADSLRNEMIDEEE